MSLRRCLYLCRRTRGLHLPATLRAVSSGSLFQCPHKLSQIRSPWPSVRSLSGTSYTSATCSQRSSTTARLQWPTPKAVIFDLGGVVVPSPQPIFDKFEEKHKLQKGSLVKTIKVKGDQGAFGKMERGEISIEEFSEPFQKEYVEVNSGELTLEQTHEFIKCLSDFTKLSPHPAVTNCIQWLKSKGIKVAILTNNFRWDNGDTVFPKESVPGVDVVVQSCIEGLKKPDKAIFDLTLERLGVAAGDAVFLDDLGGNLKTAREMGMATIKVGDIGVAMEELNAIVQDGYYSPHIPSTCEVSSKHALPDLQLATYLDQVFGNEVEGPMRVLQFKHGQSNPTYYISYKGRELVLRKKPPGKLLPSAHAVEREYQVMTAMQEAGVPVPPLHSLCETDSVVGTPFYLMGYTDGRVFKDPTLPGLHPREREVIYRAAAKVLAAIHSVDIQKANLSDFGKTGNYIQRQTERWSRQYEASKTHPIPSMDRLVDWLPSRAPSNHTTTVVHGDFRLDNLIFARDRPTVLAVLDWELSTLGDPISDLAYICMTYHLDHDQPHLKGLNGVDIAALGIPSEEVMIKTYSDCRQVADLKDNWNFYLAFTFFRVAAILQGVYKRSLQNQASASNAKEVGKMAEKFADKGWAFAQKQDNTPTRIPKPPGARTFSTLAPQNATPHRNHSTSAPSIELITGPPSTFPPRLQQLYKEVREFIREEVLPIEEELFEHQQSTERWTPHSKMEALKAKAKKCGLWNLFLPSDSDPSTSYGAGLTNLEYSHLAELMGHSLFGSEPFNCSAPDTGNMEVLVQYGSEQQKQKWLEPLLSGDIRSCFGMTEPGVASSDATNIQSSISRANGGGYTVNGRKWWISGAMDPRCKVCIFMGKTDPTAPRHKQQSMVLVPMETAGVSVLRPLTVFGYDDAPGGHAEIEFINVQVPADNLILGEGRGFEIAQGRLGPGRIHHCMRLIGLAERSLELMKERVKERVAFGKTLAERDTILADIAHSRMELEQARLLTLKAAHMMDTVGNKAARQEIAMIKVVAPHMAQRVVDRAMQAFGAKGLSADTPLAQFYSWARILRLADGPDEVHTTAVGKLELKSFPK